MTVGFSRKLRITETCFALIATCLKERFSSSRLVGLNFITGESTDHKGKKLDHGMSVGLFHSFHLAETRTFIDKLSTFRKDNDTAESNFIKCVLNSERLEMDIIARSKKGAVKLAGCILMHGGFVQPLSKNGYPISVKEDACDFPERFLVWRESTKIYTESVLLER